MLDTTDITRAVRGLTDADGRLLCGRCHNPVDDDHYCHQCGAISMPTPGRPRTTATRIPRVTTQGETAEARAAA